MWNLMVSRITGSVAKLVPKRAGLLSVFMRNPESPYLAGTIGIHVCQNKTVADKHTLSLCGLIHFYNFLCHYLISSP